MKKALKENGAGAEMQALYPEGFIFIHAMYVLSWCDLIEPLTTLSEIHQEGIEEEKTELDGRIKAPRKVIHSTEQYRSSNHRFHSKT